MLKFGSSHAEKKSFRRIKDLITPKFHEKIFKVFNNDDMLFCGNNQFKVFTKSLLPAEKFLFSLLRSF